MTSSLDLIDVFTSLKQKWDDLVTQNLLENVLPTNSSVTTLLESQQKSKEQLIIETKKLRNEFKEEIPKEQGMSLLRMYQNSCQNVYSANKKVNTDIIDIFKKISLIDDLVSTLNSCTMKISENEDLDSVILKLKNDVKDEKMKNIKVAELNETLELLKKEYHEQVKLATQSNETQIKMDFEVSINNYQDKLRNTQKELKNMESNITTLTSKRNDILEKLHQKEIDVDNEISKRNEQIDTYENELKENERLLKETESKNRDNLDKDSYLKLKKQCDEAKEILENITSKCNESYSLIETKKISIENTYSSLIRKKMILIQSIKTLNDSLNQLPSKDEWEKIKESFNSLDLYIEDEKIKNDLKENYTTNKNKLLQLKDKNSEIEKQNLYLMNQIKNEKEQINNIVNDDSSTTEIVNILKTQKKSLESACQQIDYEISQVITNNGIKRKEKENMELEIINLKKQVSEYGIQDPENLQYMPNQENSRPYAKITIKSFLKAFTTNRHFRVIIICYLIFIHLFVLLKLFN